MFDLSRAERLRDAASWLAVHAAIATLLAVFVGGAYYFITGDLLGLRVPVLFALVALVNVAVTLVTGFVANAEERSGKRARSISDVAEERLR